MSTDVFQQNSVDINKGCPKLIFSDEISTQNCSKKYENEEDKENILPTAEENILPTAEENNKITNASKFLIKFEDPTRKFKYSEARITSLDLPYIFYVLKKCREDEGILLESYLESYRELLQFFQLMGTLLSLVSIPLENQLKFVGTYVTKDPKNVYYTVESALKFEASSSKIDVRSSRSFHYNLFRLHSFLEFITVFWQSLGRIDEGDSLQAIASEGYSKTTARYDHWLIVKATYKALTFMPTKREFLNRGEKFNYRLREHLRVLLPEGVDLLSKITSKVHQFFEKYK